MDASKRTQPENVDPGLITPALYWGGVPSKSDASPKGDTTLLINQAFINPGLTLPAKKTHVRCSTALSPFLGDGKECLAVSPGPITSNPEITNPYSWASSRFAAELAVASQTPSGHGNEGAPSCCCCLVSFHSRLGHLFLGA